MLQVASLHQRLSVKANVFVYGIRSKNTNPPPPWKGRRIKKKKLKTYRKSFLPFKKIAIKVLLSYSWASNWTSQTASPTINDGFH